MRFSPHPLNPTVDTLFLVCALLGGALLILQVLLGVLGFDGHHAGDFHGEAAAAEGLELVSIRALSAGLVFFGLTGLTLAARGWIFWLVLPVALGVGFAAVVGVAVAMRALLRLESDGTVSIESAIGEAGTVYLGIPGERAGRGKVTLLLQGRTVEYQAVSRVPLPTGAAVVVVDVVAPDVVEVAPVPHSGGFLNVPA